MNIETGTELRTPIDITELVEGRNAAIGHWMAAYDKFHECRQAAADACLGAAGMSIQVPLGNNYDDSTLACAFVGFGKTEIRNPETGRHEPGDARQNFERLVTVSIDRRCWEHLLGHLGFDSLLDRQARQEFHDSLKETPPTFNEEHARATFGDIWENRRDYMLRGIANTFSALDRRFRSHDGFKIGGRLIIERAMNEWGGWTRYDRRDTLYDVEKIFCEIEGKPAPGFQGGIVADVEERARYAHNAKDFPQVVRGNYFRVRIFKNGNLHIWFERADLLREVNKLLAEYYGEVIGDAYNETEADDAPQYHITPAKGWGAFMSSDEVAARVMEYARVHEARVLEPSAGTGVLARRARGSASEVVCVEIQKGMAHELLEDGFETHCRDFLSIEPAELGLFDCVVMNPPFDRGRDCDHVMHAWKFVKPGGRLVAVMSARAEHAEDKRHRALHRMIEKEARATGWAGRVWHDLPPGSFAHAGTNVNTVILAIDKPSGATR